MEHLADGSILELEGSQSIGWLKAEGKGVLTTAAGAQEALGEQHCRTRPVPLPRRA